MYLHTIQNNLGHPLECLYSRKNKCGTVVHMGFQSYQSDFKLETETLIGNQKQANCHQCQKLVHTFYSRDIMYQNCGGNCGFEITQMKIKSFERPKSIKSYEKIYLKRQTLGRQVVCPISPGNQRIILQIVGFMDQYLIFNSKHNLIQVST